MSSHEQVSKYVPWRFHAMSPPILDELPILDGPNATVKARKSAGARATADPRLDKSTHIDILMSVDPKESAMRKAFETTRGRALAYGWRQA
jgi:hypothetical protein